MNINATIFIQAINFCVVYWILRKALFKPLITIIDDNTAHKKTLENIIADQKMAIVVQEAERDQCWNECREYCSTNSPAMVDEHVCADETGMENKQHDQNLLSHDIDVLVAEISSELEEKIKHVH